MMPLEMYKEFRDIKDIWQINHDANLTGCHWEFSNEKTNKLLNKKKKHFINEYRNGSSTSLAPLWLSGKSEKVTLHVLKWKKISDCICHSPISAPAAPTEYYTPVCHLVWLNNSNNLRLSTWPWQDVILPYVNYQPDASRTRATTAGTTWSKNKYKLKGKIGGFVIM